MNCAIHTETPAAAFCRTCGKALCENCKRDVMGAIYCEPCIAARLQGTQPAVARVPVTAVGGTPSPGLAGVLAALVPGMGAMYNGQFVKAFIYVVIFATLIVILSHGYGGLEPLFGLLVAFFWFYMIFDAVQSAKAKQLGLPAPDPLGLDRLFGIEERNSAASAVPPTESIPASTSTHATHRDHAPTGAVVLIGLGVFFLLGNLGMFHLLRLWPIILIGLGLWIAYKRTTGRG